MQVEYGPNDLVLMFQEQCDLFLEALGTNGFISNFSIVGEFELLSNFQEKLQRARELLDVEIHENELVVDVLQRAFRKKYG